MLIKICGTTSEDDALLAVAMGANAVGFVFAPSPRQVSSQRVADIVKRLPREDILTVGVFRDHAPRRVVEVIYSTGLQAAQLHGRETPDETMGPPEGPDGHQGVPGRRPPREPCC